MTPSKKQASNPAFVYGYDEAGNKWIGVKLTPAGALPVDGAGAIYQIQIDEASPYTYIGKAVPGTATADPNWQIMRIDDTTTPDAVIKWADAGAFTATWDDRATETYT